MEHSEENSKITYNDTLEVSEILHSMTNKTILINEMATKITIAVQDQSLSAGSTNNTIHLKTANGNNIDRFLINKIKMNLK